MRERVDNQYSRWTSVQVRTTLLRAALRFVEQARQLPGVHRIALVGSITTAKAFPHDVDLLVTIDEDLDLEPLGRLGRQLKGRAQNLNSGADIFLMTADARYLGRICGFRECHYRVRCEAQTCGARQHLNDDLHVVTLRRGLMQEPPIELWPEMVVRCQAPEDVQRLVLIPLQTGEDPPPVSPEETFEF